MLSNVESTVYEFDHFRIDAGKRLLWNRGEPLALTPKVFDTLVYLVRNAGNTVDKDELMGAIWPDTVVEENNLNKNISALRQLLGEKPGEHRFIVTVPGKGYKFVASVVETSANGVQDVHVVPSGGPLPALTPSKTDMVGGTRRVNSSRLRYGLVATLAIILFVAAFYLWQERRSWNAGPIHSIAILPFKPIVQESRNEAMEFGMADSLITQLSKGNDLVVRPLSETRRYAASDQNPAEIGRSLGVEAVLDGSIQVSQDRIRIASRLIRTSSGKQIWAIIYLAD